MARNALCTAAFCVLAVLGASRGVRASEDAERFSDTIAGISEGQILGRKLQQGVSVSLNQTLPGGITNTRGPDYVGRDGVNIVGGSTLPGGTSESGRTNINFTTRTVTTGGPITVAGVPIIPNTPVTVRYGRKLKQNVCVSANQTLPGVTNTRGPDCVGRTGVTIVGGSTLPGGTSEGGRTNINFTTGTVTTGGPITVAGVPVIPNTPITIRG